MFFGGKYWLNVGPAKANREMVAAESADFSILEAAAGE